MIWRVFVVAAAEADFENLDEADRLALSEELFAWVEGGPPRQTPRDVLGVTMYDDALSGGFRVTYVLDEAQQRIPRRPDSADLSVAHALLGVCGAQRRGGRTSSRSFWVHERALAPSRESPTRCGPGSGRVSI